MFSVYMDDLSKRLDKCVTGCLNAGILINHLMYVKYNPTKSTVMTLRTQEHRDTVFPGFSLNGVALPVAAKVKYLGHYLTRPYLPCVGLMLKWNFSGVFVPLCTLHTSGGITGSTVSRNSS